MSFLRDFWIYRYNFMLAIGWILMVAYLPSGSIYEGTFFGIAGTLILSGFCFATSDKTEGGEIKRIDTAIVFLTAGLATAIYWYRAWAGLPSQISLEPVFRLLTGVGFWWPGVLFVSLFRYSDDGWWPKSRSRYFKTMMTGFIASLVGLIVAVVYLKLQ